MRVNLIQPPVPGLTGATAQQVEQLGFDGMFASDSQHLVPEVWGQLLLAAGATSRIEIGPGVTNPVTRDVAVVASSALAVQQASGGRGVLAIGRGDSAVRMAGRRPASVAEFERYLTQLQSYLRLEEVDRGGARFGIRWPAYFSMDLPKMPVEVAATGPRVIEMAARVADRITLAVGADAEHLGAKLAHAREAIQRVGREGAVELGAYINAVVHPDRELALGSVRGSAATFAHFSSFGKTSDEDPEILRDAARFLGRNYRLDDHGSAGVPHADGLSDAFVDWFGIAGPPDYALSRFHALKALGLDYVTVVIGYSGVSLDVGTEARALLAKEIVPAMHD